MSNPFSLEIEPLEAGLELNENQEVADEEVIDWLKGLVGLGEVAVARKGVAAAARKAASTAASRAAFQLKVPWIQTVLNKAEGENLVVDGIFGRLTLAAIRRFQARYGLPLRGILPPETEIALIQTGLNKIAGARVLLVDGVMGNRTRQEIMRFQSRSGLVPDGVVGPKTRAAMITTLGRPSVTPPAPPTPVPPSRQLVTRKRSSVMTRDEQNQFIKDIRTLISASGNPFGRLVGIHANPLHNMHSMAGELGVQRFLSWHRLYLLRLEEMMRRVNPRAFIPYWDWTTETNVPAWIASFRPSVTIVTEDGRSVNELVRRNPPGPGESLPTTGEINSILSNQSYRGFTSDLEDGPHNTVHRWVNGTMSSIPIAPADPLFWLHHAQVDRIWSIWQASPRGQGQWPSLTGPATILDPWPETAPQVASITALNYAYAP